MRSRPPVIHVYCLLTPSKSIAKTALLLSGGVLDSREISVGRTKSEALAGSHLPADTTTPSTTTTENDTEIEQEDKPHRSVPGEIERDDVFIFVENTNKFTWNMHSAIVAEYLAHGYALSDTVIEKAIASDREYGISAKFANFFNPLAAKAQPHVDSLTSKLADLDEKKGVSLKGKAALTIGNHYYSQVLASPFGARVLAFYTNTSKQGTSLASSRRHRYETALINLFSNSDGRSRGSVTNQGTTIGRLICLYCCSLSLYLLHCWNCVRQGRHHSWILGRIRINHCCS